MNSTVIVALISFLGTLFGTIGGIVASSRLVNYRLEQLEKKVDAQNNIWARVPIIEEKIRSYDERIKRIEMRGISYEGIKINDYKDHYASGSNYKSDS